MGSTIGPKEADEKGICPQSPAGLQCLRLRGTPAGKLRDASGSLRKTFGLADGCCKKSVTDYLLKPTAVLVLGLLNRAGPLTLGWAGDFIF
jgi:hypothetical protein